MFIILLQRILLEAVLDVLYFPIWWYTGGIKYALFKVWQMIKFGNGNLAPGLWLKNIFIPMYGQYDIQGRIISFILRLVQIIFRSLALIVWIIVCLALFSLWLLVPAVIVFGLVRIII